MIETDDKIRRAVLARDDLRKEAHLPRLDIEREVVRALNQRQRQTIADTFIPHAIIICERSVPTSIMGAGLIGISNLLRLDFDLNQGEGSFLKQAFAGLQTRLTKYERSHRIGLIPYFDKPCFIAVNYSSECCRVYDMKGDYIQTLQKAHSAGSTELASNDGKTTFTASIAPQ